MSVGVQSQSFCEFYRDETINGHLLLIPSIWIGRSVRELFSRVEGSKWDAVFEVVQRIFIALGLLVSSPLIVAYGIVCIPIGLIVKWVCYEPPSPHHRGLRALETLLGSIDVHDEDAVRKAHLLLATYGDNSPAARRFKRWLQEIKNYQHFQGEIPVKRDGNCIFRAFAANSIMDGSTLVDHKEERERAVQWIRKHYLDSEHRVIKSLLVNSMFEHFQWKLDRLKKDGGDPVQMKMLQKTIGQIFSEPEEVMKEYLQDMAQPDAYGGPAEIYALSVLHQVPVVIYDKPQPKDKTLFEYLSFNLTKFQSKKPRNLLKMGRHYNVYRTRRRPTEDLIDCH